MNVLHQIEHWSLAHNPRWLVIFRVVLGVCLFVRGILFLNNLLALQLQIDNSSLSSLDNSLWLAPIISWVHILGGTLITVGLFTRASVLAQIPIVLGAIIFINSKSGVYAIHSEFIFSIFILLLLIVFFVEGGGEISMDDYAKKHLL
jgi:putative oxidoreductase